MLPAFSWPSGPASTAIAPSAAPAGAAARKSGRRAGRRRPSGPRSPLFEASVAGSTVASEPASVRVPWNESRRRAAGHPGIPRPSRRGRRPGHRLRSADIGRQLPTSRAGSRRLTTHSKNRVGMRGFEPRTSCPQISSIRTLDVAGWSPTRRQHAGIVTRRSLIPLRVCACWLPLWLPPQPAFPHCLIPGPGVCRTGR